MVLVENGNETLQQIASRLTCYSYARMTEEGTTHTTIKTKGNPELYRAIETTSLNQGVPLIASSIDENITIRVRGV